MSMDWMEWMFLPVQCRRTCHRLRWMSIDKRRVVCLDSVDATPCGTSHRHCRDKFDCILWMENKQKREMWILWAHAILLWVWALDWTIFQYIMLCYLKESIALWIWIWKYMSCMIENRFHRAGMWEGGSQVARSTNMTNDRELCAEAAGKMKFRNKAFFDQFKSTFAVTETTETSYELCRSGNNSTGA